MNQEALSILLRDVLLPSMPGRTLRRVMEACSDESVRPMSLAEIIRENPAYSQFLMSLSLFSQRIAEWDAEDPRRTNKEKVFTDRILALMGKSAIRNQIVCMRLARLSRGGLPRKKGERLSLQPQKQLSKALACEELSLVRKWIHPDWAFCAGLHYDWISAVLEARKAPAEAKTVLSEAYQEGLKLADIAYELSKRLRSVSLNEFVIGGALLAPIGKAAMAMLFPKEKAPLSWGAFISDCSRFGSHVVDAELLLERKRFNLTHAELSAWLVSSLGFFDQVEPAIRYYQEPWMLLGSRQQHSLAMALSIASALVRSPGVRPDGSLPLEGYQREWMEKNGAPVADFGQALLDAGKIKRAETPA